MACLRMSSSSLALCISFCCLFLVYSQARFQYQTRHKHSQRVSPVSRPLTTAPVPAPAPYVPPCVNKDSSNSSGIYDVRIFGAVGDGVTDDTKAFKLAWQAACEFENAILLVPNGYTYLIQPVLFTGPCQSGLLFQVDGTLMAPDGPKSWPKNASRHQWLSFNKISDFSLQGGGLIDGRGEKWWELPCKPHKGIKGSTSAGLCVSPVAIRFFLATNLTIQSLKIKNSPEFHFRLDNCSNVHIDSLDITAPTLSPNTDGVHIENTYNVKIYNSVISNGDDCVSIGSGSHDVDIKNITCGPSHGISIGSLGSRGSHACVWNVTVRDSKIWNSDNGVRIKTWQGGSGKVSGVEFGNIRMDNVRNPIIIDQFYCPRKDCVNHNPTSAVVVSGVSYAGIRGTYDTRSPPVHFGCSDTMPCANLTLSEVELRPAHGDGLRDAFCLNAYGDLRSSTIPPVACLLDGLPPQYALDKTILDDC